MTEKNGVCFVTGGAGFIGCAISSQLVKRYARVIAIDNLHPQIHLEKVRPAALHAQVELRVGDVTDSATWDSILNDVRPDAVVHLAAETGTGQSLTESTRHTMVNVVGTSQMLDGLSRCGCVPQKLLLTSSRAVYGEGRWQSLSNGTIHYPGQRSQNQLQAAQWDFEGMRALPFSASDTQPAPTSIYGATKLAQEHLMQAWSLAFNSSLRVLRLQNVYGTGQSLSNPYTGIVSLFIRLAKAGRSIPLYEDGEMTRDFVFIDDVAAAIIASLESEQGGFVADIGTGKAASIRTAAEIITERYGSPAPHVSGKFRNGDVRHAACSIDESKRLLAWQPEISLETGLERLCQWIDAQPNIPPVN